MPKFIAVTKCNFKAMPLAKVFINPEHVAFIEETEMNDGTLLTEIHIRPSGNLAGHTIHIAGHVAALFVQNAIAKR